MSSNITIKNVAVTGYIKSGRSVGGIVGKTLNTAMSGNVYSITVSNCLNFAEIVSSDSKGTGGIVGAGWNAPVYIDNCANFGKVTANYQNGGGISGSFEGISRNCYNVGDISKSAANNGQAFGTSNAAGARVYNFYWLTGTSNTAGANAAVYGGNAANTTYEITDNYNDSGLSAAGYMKSAAFLAGLNKDVADSSQSANYWAFAQQADPINILMDSMGLAGFPVPAVFATPAVPEPVVVDKDALEALAGDAAVYSEEDYTAESWAVFAAALSAAQDILADENAAQGDVDVAVMTLQAAMDALEAAPEPVIYYTVTFEYNDGATQAGSVDVEDGLTVEQPANPYREGYNFLGWYLGEDLFDFNTAITAGITLSAMWEKIPAQDVVLVSATPSAYVTKLNGNQNDLTITIVEAYSNGVINTITVTLKINNNAAGTYAVGAYKVYVDTKGNDQIRDCHIAG